MIIRWTNTYSREIGFVKSIDYKNRHFNNTFNENEAKKFVSIASAEKAINKLHEYGEDELNIFEII